MIEVAVYVSVVLLIIFMVLYTYQLYKTKDFSAHVKYMYGDAREHLKKIAERPEVFQSREVKADTEAGVRTVIAEVDGALTDLIVTTKTDTHLLMRIEGADGRGRTLVDADMIALQSRIVRLGSDSRVEPASIVVTTSSSTCIKVQIIEVRN